MSNTRLCGFGVAFAFMILAVASPALAANTYPWPSSGDVGIGTTSPTLPLTVYSSGFPILGIADGTGGGPEMQSYGGSCSTCGGGYHGQYARGSYASPSAVQSGDRLGYFITSGYVGSNFVNATAVVGGVGTGTISSTSLPSYISFETEPSGSVTRTERMRIDQNGNVGIGTTSPTSELEIYNTTGSANAWAVSAYNGGQGTVGVWDTNTSSVGVYLFSGAGGNSGIATTNNAGSYTSTAVEFTSSGNSIFYGNVGIGTTSPSEALEVNGEVKVDTFASGGSTAVCANGNVLSSCSSSIRYKEKVRPASFGLNEVMEMHPVTFKWKGRDENDFGLVAEDVEKVNPLFVTYKDGAVEGVKYPQLTAVLVKAVQEQQAEIDDLKRMMERLSKH